MLRYSVSPIIYRLLRTSLIVITVFLSACSVPNLQFPGVYKVPVQQGNIITQDMIDQLRPGMTRRQVIFVMGTPIPVVPTTPVAEALRTMVVVITGPEGEQDRGKGSDVLEHPLNAVIWLAQELQRQGLSLKKGDLVSVGSFSKLLPPKAGQKITVQYQGLPGNPVVSVNFK